ncbi:MAG: putative polyphosphate/ATP-dependent NAD kinase [Oceanicoccus sp.]
MLFRLGLIVNPMAGIGGPLALKGSDGASIVRKALADGGVSRAPQRALQALQVVEPLRDKIKIICFDGGMGGDIVKELGFPLEVVGYVDGATNAEDTIRAAQTIKVTGVDLLVFVGGDGTARDIHQSIGSDFPVLGIPSGVKMHSGVYAVSPQAAGEIIHRLVSGKLVDIGLAEVKDIDEQAFREGMVRAKYYGELLVPREGHFLQQVKSSGREVEELVLQDIAADIVESMEENCLYLIGPGTTTRAVMEELDIPNSLLGVDAILRNRLLGADLREKDIVELLADHSGHAKMIITPIGGQGHIIGRGNQQFSPNVIRQIGLDNIIVIATKTKITELQGRPLMVDSNDALLDKDFSGFRQVITGYHDVIMYPVGLGFDDVILEESKE